MGINCSLSFAGLDNTNNKNNNLSVSSINSQVNINDSNDDNSHENNNENFIFDDIADFFIDTGASVASWVGNAIDDFASSDVGKALSSTVDSIVNGVETAGATILTGATMVVNAAGNIVEGVVDFAALLGTALLTPVAAIEDGVSYLTTGEGAGKIDEMWSGTMDFVSTEYVNDFFVDIYTNNEIGKAINDKSLFKVGSDEYKIATTVTEVIGDIALTFFTAGGYGAAKAGMKATTTGAKFIGKEVLKEESKTVGKTMAKQGAALTFATSTSRNAGLAYKDGANAYQALGYGILNGAWDGAQWLIGGKIAGQGLKTIGIDALSGASDTPLRTAFQSLYSDKSYAENFEANGGIGSMALGAGLGGGLSAIGEVSTVKNILGNSRIDDTVSEINLNKIYSKQEVDASEKTSSLLSRTFDRTTTYAGYDSVYKVDSNLKESISNLKNIESSSSKILVEIPNSSLLTTEAIEELPDNIEVRINGGLTDEYMNGHKSPMTSSLQKATYSKEELVKINDILTDFDSNINPSWNDYQKAYYAYDYVKNKMEYVAKPEPGGINYRGREYDTLTGLIEGKSTCAGFSYIYKDLLDRMGIECKIIGGSLNGEGQHAYNIVSIEGNNFLVDTVKSELSISKGITGFGAEDYSTYIAKNNLELKNNINTSNTDLITYLKDYENPVNIQYNAYKMALNGSYGKYSVFVGDKPVEGFIAPRNNLTKGMENLFSTRWNKYSELEKIAKSNGTTIKALGKKAEDGAPVKEVENIARGLAKDIRMVAKEQEPLITETMKSLEDDNAYLIGLDYRLKGEDSLTRKIISDADVKEKGKKMDQVASEIGKKMAKAASEIGDSVRYTLLIDDFEYVSKIESSLDSLVQKGFTIKKFKNFWRSDSATVYQGINVQVVSPENLKFELQFHTPQSFSTKEYITHSLYEIGRNDSNALVTDEIRSLVNEIQIIDQKLVEVPDGIIGYDYLKK